MFLILFKQQSMSTNYFSRTSMIAFDFVCCQNKTGSSARFAAALSSSPITRGERKVCHFFFRADIQFNVFSQDGLFANQFSR